MSTVTGTLPSVDDISVASYDAVGGSRHQLGDLMANEYPLVKIEVSHKSHPFYTGKAQFVDTAGRIDKFRQKYAKFNKEDKAEG